MKVKITAVAEIDIEDYLWPYLNEGSQEGEEQRMTIFFEAYDEAFVTSTIEELSE